VQSQRDADILVDGLKLSIKLANTPALQKYGLAMDTTPVKACDGYEFGSDEYFACAVRRETGPEYHQGGTCKMFPADDKLAVVDNQAQGTRSDEHQGGRCQYLPTSLRRPGRDIHTRALCGDHRWRHQFLYLIDVEGSSLVNLRPLHGSPKLLTPWSLGRSSIVKRFYWIQHIIILTVNCSKTSFIRRSTT
jgi:hypothetical protein